MAREPFIPLIHQERIDKGTVAAQRILGGGLSLSVALLMFLLGIPMSDSRILLWTGTAIFVVMAWLVFHEANKNEKKLQRVAEADAAAEERKRAELKEFYKQSPHGKPEGHRKMIDEERGLTASRPALD